MFRPMKVHHQEVSCRIQALWYNVMSKSIQYYGELCSVLILPCLLHLQSLSFSQCPCSSPMTLTAVSQPATELLNRIRNCQGRLSVRILTSPTGISWVYSVAPGKYTNITTALYTPILVHQALPFNYFPFQPDIFLPTHCRCRGLLLHLIILKTNIPSVGLLWTSDQPVADTST